MGNISPDLMRALPQPVRLWAARRAVARLKHRRAADAAIKAAATVRARKSVQPPSARTPRFAPASRVAGVSRIGRMRAEMPSLCLLAAALACSAALGYVGGQDAGHVRDAIGEGFPTPWSNDAPVTATPAATSDLAGGAAATSTGKGMPPPAAARADGTNFVPALARGVTGSDSSTRAPEHLPEGSVAESPAAPLGTDPLIAEIGRLHAEILRLRILFRRLADVAELEDGEFDLELEPFDLPSVRSAVDGLDLSIRALDPISTRSGALESVFDTRRAAYDRRVGGKVAPGTVRSSGFGLRRSPFGTARRELHQGLDFAGPRGTPILALADGIVTWSGMNGGYGNLVELDHGDGLRTRYAHNQRNLVARGGRVRKGQSIALVGSSGRSTGPHVHVEVRQDGVPLDPAPFVR